MGWCAEVNHSGIVRRSPSQSRDYSGCCVVEGHGFGIGDSARATESLGEFKEPKLPHLIPDSRNQARPAPLKDVATVEWYPDEHLGRGSGSIPLNASNPHVCCILMPVAARFAGLPL